MQNTKTHVNYKSLTLRYSVFLLLLCLGIVFTSLQKKEIYTPISNTKNYLAKYGEYIFNREPCLACHSLEIKTAEDRISLDGLGGKYQDYFLFLLLQDPNQVKIDSEMPSFAHLIQNKIDTQTFCSKLGFTKGAWKILEQQADSLTLALKYDSGLGKNFKNSLQINRSEMIALIAYLQSIPATKEQRQKDSLYHVTLTNLTHNLNQLIQNPQSSLYQKPYTAEEITKGKNNFQNWCATCHRSDGGGIIGPNLTDDYWIHGDSESDIARVVAFGGKEGKGMIAWGQILNEDDLRVILAYIQSIKGTHANKGKQPEGK